MFGEGMDLQRMEMKYVFSTAGLKLCSSMYCRLPLVKAARKGAEVIWIASNAHGDCAPHKPTRGAWGIRLTTNHGQGLGFSCLIPTVWLWRHPSPLEERDPATTNRPHSSTSSSHRLLFAWSCLDLCILLQVTISPAVVCFKLRPDQLCKTVDGRHHSHPHADFATTTCAVILLPSQVVSSIQRNKMFQPWRQFPVAALSSPPGVGICPSHLPKSKRTFPTLTNSAHRLVINLTTFRDHVSAKGGRSS
jgi:hypothetical protein